MREYRDTSPPRWALQSNLGCCRGKTQEQTGRFLFLWFRIKAASCLSRVSHSLLHPLSTELPPTLGPRLRQSGASLG